jgi:cation transport protein ChaC
VTESGGIAYDRAMPPPNAPLKLTREYLLDETLREQIKQFDPELELMPAESQRASIMSLLEERATRDGVWVFAYGSLMWNPLFHFVERGVGQVHGHHRRYCLWARLGRGTPERPGLMLGLDRGGSCRGVVYRIAEAEAMAELGLIWRREMLTNAYDPQWVKVVTLDGVVDAIAFLINRDFPRYIPSLSEDEIVAAIATARGRLGECATYLFNTVEHLEELGIRDRMLERLRDKVRARRAAAPRGTE